jgi:Polysaccharide pyruvyl transferase
MSGWADHLHRSGPLVVFGAFDRHNFGDLLFPHIVEAIVPGRELIFAGVTESDLRGYGGHRVEAIARVAETWEARYGDSPTDVIHVGGEILSCNTYGAALMALSPSEANAAIRQHEQQQHTELERIAWAQRLLGIPHRAAYVLPKTLFARPGAFVFAGVGGSSLDRLAPDVRDEVLASLRAADYVGVRDPITRAILLDAGIDAHPLLDPVTDIARLFADRVRSSADGGEAGCVRRALAEGYIAVQFSTAFGDEQTLADIARQLDRVAADMGVGIALFRAGAAFAHDDLDCYRAVAQTMQSRRTHVFESLDVWDICALIAGSRAYCGSSLHGRIVADAFSVPAVSLLRSLPPDAQPKKIAAYAATAAWSAESLCDAGSIAAGLAAALNL